MTDHPDSLPTFAELFHTWLDGTPSPTLGVCDACARTRRLDPHGRVVVHYLTIDVSTRAVRSVGAGRGRRRCPGSLRPPRDATRRPSPQ